MYVPLSVLNQRLNAADEDWGSGDDDQTSKKICSEIVPILVSNQFWAKIWTF